MGCYGLEKDVKRARGNQNDGSNQGTDTGMLSYDLTRQAGKEKIRRKKDFDQRSARATDG